MVCQDGLNGYLDNTNHFIFWLCNMKQLNFRHFNTNSKKFCEAVIFFQKEEKKAPERLILSYLVCQGVFGHHYYDNLFPKISEKPSKHQAQLPAGVRENDPPPPPDPNPNPPSSGRIKDRTRGTAEIEPIQTLSSTFFGSSKHFKIGQFNRKH